MTDYTELTIGTNTVYVYTPAVKKLDDIIKTPDNSGIVVKKNITNKDFSLKFKNGSSDATNNLERYICHLYTFPFSNWDYKDKGKSEKCTKLKTNGSNVVYIDINNNTLKKSTVKSEDNGYIKVQDYDPSIAKGKAIFLDNDYSTYFEQKYNNTEYENFLKKNKAEIDTLLNGYTVSGSIGTMGTSANMKLRNTFLENLSKATSGATSEAGKPLNLDCNLTKLSNDASGGRKRGRKTRRKTRRKNNRRKRKTMKKIKTKKEKKTRRNKKTKRVRFRL